VRKHADAGHSDSKPGKLCRASAEILCGRFPNNIHRVSKKQWKLFCHNLVKFLLTLIFFGKLMAKTTKLCKVCLFSTSPNLCQCTTMLNIDAPNCCWVVVSGKRCNELIRHKIHLNVNYATELKVCITTRLQIRMPKCAPHTKAAFWMT